MSIVNEAGEKIDLPRAPGHVYSQIENDWAGTDPERWKNLLILQAHVSLGWTEARLALTFGLHQGNISRRLQATRHALAQLSSLRALATG